MYVNRVAEGEMTENGESLNAPTGYSSSVARLLKATRTEVKIEKATTAHLMSQREPAVDGDSFSFFTGK